MAKAPLAIAIIARNAARTLGACLDSVVPYVEQVAVSVDETTTDETAKIAREHGAEVYEGLKVSDWHECPYHGRVLAQHFANARQASFARLRKDIPYWGWLDSDDILDGSEKLAEVLAKLAPEAAGLWLAYHYSKAGPGGPTTTLFDRERIVRSDMAWQWQHRVHEVLAPAGVPTESLNWVRTDAISVVHQGEGHDTAGSARRNITLLEIDLEENENDMRAWFYLGNQYFALNDWAQAATCYERSTAATNPYQLWQALVYLSMAYEKLGDIAQARTAAFKALDVQPQHPEPYYRLAATYMMQGDEPRTEFWTHLGDQMPDPPFFVFRNPLDRTYNARLMLATVYAHNGNTSKARRELEQAASVVPSQETLDGLAYQRALEEDAQTAEAWVTGFEQMRRQFNMICSGNLLGLSTSEFLGSMPSNVWRFGRVRDIVVPNIISNRVNTQPRIVFWCGRSAEPWAPPSIDTTGIGGSETAVIQIARRFARDGWRVDVYNDCDKYEGEYENVGYWDCGRLNEGESGDILVSWRNPRASLLPFQRKVSLLWCHDLNSGAIGRDDFSKWDMVLAVSRWHAGYLSELYGLGENTGYTPNGIELERFGGFVSKVPFRCVYASSPDRGLERLLELWPRFVEQEPAAELHIAYGWNTIDKYIALGHQQLAVFKEHINHMVERTPNVVWRGRLPQNELAKLYQESQLLLYPSDFLETFCIAAVEAMAAGCVPVTSGVGALAETIGEGGLVVNGNVYTRAWRDFYCYVARAAMAAPELRLKYVKAGKERAQSLTWDNAYQEHWRPLVTRLLAGTKEREEALV